MLKGHCHDKAHVRSRLMLFFQGISIPQMNTIHLCGFTVGHFTQTPVKFLFSESLIIIVDYKGIFIEIKKSRFSEYSALFPKVHRFTYQIHFQSDLSGSM